MTNLLIENDLYRCSRCGLCEPTCPSYQAFRLERYAPRGRLQIIRKMQEGKLDVSKSIKESISSCILCETCSDICPSGVPTGRIFSKTKDELYDRYGLSFIKKSIFHALRHPFLLSMGALLGRQSMFLASKLPSRFKLGTIPLNRLPRFNRKPFKDQVKTFHPSREKSVGSVLYFVGCATNFIDEHIGHKTIELLTALGYDVIVPKTLHCCALPIFLSGAHNLAEKNIIFNIQEISYILEKSNYIVFDCATCGSAFKKYIPEILMKSSLHDLSLNVASRSKDITEILCQHIDQLKTHKKTSQVKTLHVTYHDSCHLKRGMHVTEEPRRLLSACPWIDFQEMPEAEKCCGGGGSYQFEHVDLSQKITAQKLISIRDTRATLVTTGCPGCRLTLSAALNQDSDPKVLHPIEIF